MKSASVVIVGGGVVGASVAWHLAMRGWKDILVIDRSAGPGEGSTGRATGGFRAQYATAINVALSLLAREKLRRFREEVGADPGYLPAGYLWLAASDHELAILSQGVSVQHAAGLAEARQVGPEEIVAINPAIAHDGIVGGTWCPTDGFIRPLSMLGGYLEAARRMQVRIEWGVAAEGLARGADGRITAVETRSGPIATDAVVDAAGPWAAELAAHAGVRLPVAPLRRQLVPTIPCDLLPADMPMTLFAGDGFHFRVRDGRVLFGYPTPGVPGRPFDMSSDPAWVDSVAGRMVARVPPLRGVPLDRAGAWGGLYEVTPDKHAILGAAPDCPNLYFANGSSGHGVMHSPALGHLLAEIMSDAVPTIDPSPLAFTRFAEGRLNPVSELL